MYQLPFLRLWHQSLELRLGEAMDGWHPLVLRLDEVADPEGCRLGLWIAAHHSVAGLGTAMGGLKRCHDTFHKVAGRAVSAHLEGDARPVVDGHRRQLTIASEALAHAIDGVETQARKRALLPTTVSPDSFWSDAWNIGIPIVDAQHQAIAALASKIARYPDAALNSELGVDFLTDFHQVLAEHFITEECVMRASAIPESLKQAHIQEHTALLEKIAHYSFEQAFKRGPKFVSEIMAELAQFIVGHVVEYDFMLKPNSI